MQSLKVSLVSCKTHDPSELHVQGDCPKFLILGLVFLLGQVNDKTTRRKKFCILSAEEERDWSQQRPSEAKFLKEIGFL